MVVSKEELVIFDTTLRDGEQSPGVSLTHDSKVQIAKQLSKLGVTVCEAGFPVASEGDFVGTQRIAREVGPLTEGRPDGKPMIICGLARSKKTDIARCYEAIKDAPRHRIHLFLATSDIHLKYKLKIDREKCLELIKEHVEYAKSLCDDIEFSPEDAGRTDQEFLAKACGVAIAAGATTLNIPDTVGYVLPELYGAKIRYLVENTPGFDPAKVRFSTHCHNDLGLATANTLAGIQHGARQVEVTVNGIGERAGNTSLEEVVMALRTHPNRFPVYTSIDTPLIMRTSEMVSLYTGMTVQKNKAIVGANAFAHESGIHQDGMLKHSDTYEIIKPEDVGVETSLVLGKHSGRAALKSRLEELGYSIDGDSLNEIFTEFKKICDTGSTVKDHELDALMSNSLSNGYGGCKNNDCSTDKVVKPRVSAYQLKDLSLTCTKDEMNLAKVTITCPDGINVATEASANGPINAIFRAILKGVKCDVTLEDFEVKSIKSGDAAIGKANVRIKAAGQDLVYIGHGTSQNIVLASAYAIINSINNFQRQSQSAVDRSEFKRGLI